MVEILQTIVLICQVSSCSVGNVINQQKKCHKEMIACVSEMKGIKKTDRWSDIRLVNCIKER